MLPLSAAVLPSCALQRPDQPSQGDHCFRRVRPADAGWPSDAEWRELDRAVGGRLLRVESPFASCRTGDDDACRALLRTLSNPYALGDDIGLTQATGWIDAWESVPSAYAVAATRAADYRPP